MMHPDLIWDVYSLLDEHTVHGVDLEGNQCKGWGSQEVFLCTCGLRKAQEKACEIGFEYEREYENLVLAARYLRDEQLSHLAASVEA